MSAQKRAWFLLLQLALLGFISGNLLRTAQRSIFPSEYKHAMSLMEDRHYAQARKIFRRLMWYNSGQRDLLLYDTAVSYWMANDTPGFLQACQQLARRGGQAGTSSGVTKENYQWITWADGILAAHEKKMGHQTQWRGYVEMIRTISLDMIRRYPGQSIAVEADSVLGIYDILEGRTAEAKEKAIKIKAGRYYPQSGYILMAMCYEYEKNYEAAKNEYRALLTVSPLRKQAQVYLHNLETGKSNLQEYEKLLTDSVT